MTKYGNKLNTKISDENKMKFQFLHLNSHPKIHFYDFSSKIIKTFRIVNNVFSIFHINILLNIINYTSCFSLFSYYLSNLIIFMLYFWCNVTIMCHICKYFPYFSYFQWIIGGHFTIIVILLCLPRWQTVF